MVQIDFTVLLVHIGGQADAGMPVDSLTQGATLVGNLQDFIARK